MSKMTRWGGRRRSSGALPGLSLGQTRDLLRGLGKFFRIQGTPHPLPDLVRVFDLEAPPGLQEVFRQHTVGKHE